jgi:hypothetical protein
MTTLRTYTEAEQLKVKFGGAFKSRRIYGDRLRELAIVKENTTDESCIALFQAKVDEVKSYIQSL